MQAPDDKGAASASQRDPLAGEQRLVGTETIPEGFGQKFLLERGGDLPPHEVLVMRIDGRLHAMHTLCPHAGGRLAEGPLTKGRYPSCPLHLYKFDPESGAALEVDCPPATVYAIEEVGDGEARLQLPEHGLSE